MSDNDTRERRISQSEYDELVELREEKDREDREKAKAEHERREAMGPPTHRVYTADGKSHDLHMVPTHHNGVPVTGSHLIER